MMKDQFCGEISRAVKLVCFGCFQGKKESDTMRGEGLAIMAGRDAEKGRDSKKTRGPKSPEGQRGSIHWWLLVESLSIIEAQFLQVLIPCPMAMFSNKSFPPPPQQWAMFYGVRIPAKIAEK